MLDGPVDDQMIEIGDPTEEPSGVEAPHRVVIQYHERGGVPWMLIPPLLLISAVVAVLLYAKFGPRDPNRHVVQAVDVVNSLGERPIGTPPTTPWTDELQPPPPLEKRPDEPPAAIELVATPAPSPTPAPAPAPADSSPSSSTEPVKALDPPSVPRVEGLGFDPKALDAERKGEAASDPALTPANRDDAPMDVEKPREIDPDLLPPDPRQAKARQQQRRVETLKKVEDERGRFHTDLRAICRKFREESGPEILDLNKRYDIRVEPLAEKKALQLFGKTGQFVGADRRTRVEVLRSLGYPEPVILSDLFDNYEKKMIGQRDGPRHPGEAYYLAALSLLRCPPNSVAPRSVSATKNNPTPRPNSHP